MVTVAFASGKGGAGKTTLAMSFHKFLKDSSVFADCDVDAADAFLILEKEILKQSNFTAGWKYRIDSKLCRSCGACFERCVFSAIKHENKYSINPLQCEGCGACFEACSNNAISKEENVCGTVFVSKTLFGSDMVYARLEPGEDNSGKLVFEVKNIFKSLETAQSADYGILDCPPGIACPLVSSLTDIDVLVTVVEASRSGFIDAQRLINLAQRMELPTIAVINKAGVNEHIDKAIEEFLLSKAIRVSGRIPFDERVIQNLNKKELLIDHPNLHQLITKIFHTILKDIQKTRSSL